MLTPATDELRCRWKKGWIWPTPLPTLIGAYVTGAGMRRNGRSSPVKLDSDTLVSERPMVAKECFLGQWTIKRDEQRYPIENRWVRMKFSRLVIIGILQLMTANEKE